MPISVCFVCLGNICRSPTAEGIFVHLVQKAGLTDQILVGSAGTSAYHTGELPDARSREHARRRGYRLESRARQFLAEDFERFDYVLAMDTRNLTTLRSLLPPGGRSRARLQLFRDFDADAGPEASVPDPYLGGSAGFEEVLDQCERAARGLLQALVAEKKTMVDP
jgi:protein-tyrosine phosphatase